MRALFIALLLGMAGTALLPAHDARAWWDRFGRWHADYYAPPVYAPPVYAAPPVYGPNPYARWVPPHYDRFGRYIPGRWI